MSEILKIIDSFKCACDCGVTHETTIKDIQIGSGLVNSVGEILKKNGFPKNILLVADKNTLRAADGITESLDGFSVSYKIYDDLRVAEIEHANEIGALIRGKDMTVLSVGTGSVNDPCRLACAVEDKKLCIFATAPSLDGFASYSSPIVASGFKSSYPAKSPEVIIGDTKILAAAPVYLKSAGFGDMVAKYIGLADWKISSLLTDEVYCEKVAKLTRDAVDKLMSMSDRVTQNDEETAGEIFKALHDFSKEKGLYLAIQCCEHLNRAIITERKAVPFAETVNVIPQPKAGGSLATKAYAGFEEPVALEEIKADAGLDIGLTLIGMHLKKVAVPVRLEHNRIGEAIVVAARTRAKFIGGSRAVYDENLL